MQISAQEIVKLLGGTIEGDPRTIVTKPAKIEEGKNGDISFIANPKYINFAYTTQASIILIDKQMKFTEKINSTLIRVDDPYDGFSKILHIFNGKEEKKTGIEANASIHEGAKIHKDVYVGAFTYVGDKSKIGKGSSLFAQVYIGDDVTIGENTLIYPGVKIYNHSIIGNNCILHSGTVIGSDGFGFTVDNEKKYQKIPQVGNVLIEDDVEIGANSTIDRATMGSTHIHKGVKIDNLVQIAHNVEVGDHTVIVSQTGISGSTKIGKHCMIGGQVGFVGHITIADGTKINAKSGVSKSVLKEGTSINGVPAYNYTSSLRSQAIYRRLPELEKELEALKKNISDKKKDK